MTRTTACKQSRFAIAALVVLFLAFSIIVGSFFRDEGSRGGFFGPELGDAITVLLAGAIWIVAGVLTAIAGIRAFMGRCRWHLVVTATVLCVLFTLAAWVRLNPPSTRLLVSSAGRGDKGLARWCLAMGVDVNKPRETRGLGSGTWVSETPLTMAAKSRQPEMVSLLVQNGADVNLPDGQGWTPLASAVSIADPATVKLLLDLGAKVELPHLNRPIRLFEMIDQSLETHPDLETRARFLQVRELLEKAAPATKPASATKPHDP
jgi:hypothetical protein